jgi:hypothetical protein
MKKKRDLFLVLAVILYFLSLLLVYFDRNYFYRWFALVLSLIPLFLVLFIYLKSLGDIKFFKEKKFLLGLIVVFILATSTRFFLLANYPFVSVGDEVREPGYNTQRIENGKVKNIFAYGQYDAYGLIISTSTLGFYKIFGGSVLTYRIPAAIVSILDIVCIYLLLIFVTKNVLASFLGSMALISLPLHLYYSRTELVVILSSLFSTLNLIALFVFLKRKSRSLVDYVFLGTLFGFSFGLHGSIKAMSLILIVIVFCINFFQLIQKKNYKTIFKRMLIFLVFILLGFGPRILKTSGPDIFFNTSRLPFVSKVQYSRSDLSGQSLGQKYLRSLLVWIVEPTTAWYADQKPILTPILFSILIMGLATAIFKKNYYLLIIIFTALSLHLTNSALTDMVNGDHRLSPLLPIGVIFIGYGLGFIFEKLKNKKIKCVLSAFLFLFFLTKIFYFFEDQPANKNKNIGDYLSMHMIYFINSNQYDAKTNDNLRLLVSPKNYEKFTTLHYAEQYEYFLPNLNLEFQSTLDVLDNELYIINGENAYLQQSRLINCNKRSYFCPLNYNDNIFIYF